MLLAASTATGATGGCFCVRCLPPPLPCWRWSLPLRWSSTDAWEGSAGLVAGTLAAEGAAAALVGVALGAAGAWIAALVSAGTAGMLAAAAGTVGLAGAAEGRARGLGWLKMALGAVGAFALRGVGVAREASAGAALRRWTVQTAALPNSCVRITPINERTIHSSCSQTA